MTEHNEYQGGAHRLEDAEPVQRRLPLRGLAMILIAVAVLLGAWAIYASKSEDDTVVAQTEVSTTQATEPQPSEATPAEQPSEQPAQRSSEEPKPAQEINKVVVLNNSTVQGMAATVADKLAAEGWQKGNVGNYSASVVPQNTVYFNPQTPGAEQAARKLAERVGGVAQAGQPAGTGTPDALVLILAKDIP